jgi:hypothetical protein
MNPPDDAKKVAVERGPNYDWKHEAEHYRAECDRLRSLLYKVEFQGERDAFERDTLKEQNAALEAQNKKLREALEESYGNYIERASKEATEDPESKYANSALQQAIASPKETK